MEIKNLSKSLKNNFMKHFYFTFFFLLMHFVTIAQQGQGIPVKNLTAIKRIENSTESFSKSSTLSSLEVQSLAPTTTPTGSSPEVGVTPGELTISLSGAANYSIPLLIPPGINGVVPQISLNYNSQQGLSGTAARGWDISGVSSITRIPSSKFHDGIIDPVDFDALDRFALDGQRLIAKNGGVYGADGTEYETENFSNIKITSRGVHPSGANYGPASFVVKYPDGSTAQFGIILADLSPNEPRSLTTWAISYVQNLQSIAIYYKYAQTNNVLRLTDIIYGGQGIVGNRTLNSIQFTYKDRENPEQYYVGNVSFSNTKILEKISISSFGTPFKNYTLTSNTSDQITSITEKDGLNTKNLNPTVFTYGNTVENLTYKPITTGLDVASTVSYNGSGFAGDFDGDGKMDCILYTGNNTAADAKYWLYYDIASGNNNSIGYTHPIGPFEKIFTTTWLSPNNKIVPNGWTVAKKNPTNYTFTVYSMGTVNPIYEQYTRTVNFPTVVVNTECDKSCRVIPDRTRSGIFPKKILSGDFNGDGITDVIAIDTELIATNSCTPLPVTNPPSCGYLTGISIPSKKVYFIDLKSDNSLIYSGELAVGLSTSAKIEIGDFNGDGKSDFYVFETGFVKIYSLNENNNLILLYQNTVSDPIISFFTPNVGTGGGTSVKPILMGDYNGDGKTDFMIPNAADSTIWYKYMSTGTSIIKQSKTFATLPFKTGTYTYGAADYNNDNKADLLITRTYNITNNGLTGQMEMEYVVNKNGDFKSETGFSFKANTATDDFAPSSPNILLYADQNSINYAAPYNPSLEIAFFNKNKIHYFNSDKNYKKDNLLSNVTIGNGVQEAISYIPLDQKYTGDSPYNKIYNSGTFIENYPNVDIQIEPNLFVVCKLEKQSTSVYKKRLFTYYNAVANSEGLGFLGFRAINQTDWHDDNTTLFSNIFKNDITLRGAVKEAFKVPNMYYPTSETPSPQDFFSKSVFEYNSADALQSNKVFKLKIINAKQYNGLENTNTELTSIVYDNYININSSTTYTKEGSNVIKTYTLNNTYDNLSSPYVIGRLSNSLESTDVSGSLMTKEDSYLYTNNLLTQIRKKGNNTGTIIQDNQYDNFGNVKTKTVTATDPATPRVNSYQYDPSGRFVTKITDNDNLISTFDYYWENGLLKNETNPYGSTSYTYDSWFKKLTETDNLGIKILYSYIKSGNETTVVAYKVAPTLLDRTTTQETFDDLGRKIRKGKVSITGGYSYVSYLYDIYDRIYKISEPYFGTTPSQWNETKFDIYSRPVESILFNNRTISTTYQNLQTSTTDGLITKKLTRDGNGNVISTNETLGGDINYKYYANGNLKQTSYNGISIDIEQDGWGRKTKMIDPAAGTFTYTNNDFGELTEETSQNGNVVTTITRDPSGRPTKKIIMGGGTNSEINYTYDSTKLPVTITYIDHNEPAASNTIVKTISYDNTVKRVLSIEENKIGVSKFTTSFQYDANGRISIQTKIAEIGGLSSSVITKNGYKQGDLYQIRDVNNKILWQANTINAKGEILESVIGNGIKMTNTYDINGYLSTTQHDKTTTPAGNILTLTTAFDKNTDNLDNRINSSFGNYTEAFKYDEINRLKKFTNKLGIEEEQTYDASGKITSNNIGIYDYDPIKKYQNTSITLAPEATGYYANREGIFNDSMEDKSGWGKEKYPNTDFFSYDDTKTPHATGKTTLKLANSTPTEQYLFADKWIEIDNAVPTEYTYSAWVYSDNPQAQMFLFMRDNPNGSSDTADNVVDNTVGSWTKISKTVLVPANVKKLMLRLDNNGLGNIWYDDVQIRKTSDPISSIRKLDVTYNAFKGPLQIEETGVDKLSFTYNDDNQRSTMYYGGLEDKLQRPMRKHYSADGTMEIKENITTGAIEFITYIGGDAYSAPIVVKSNGTTQNYLYLHRDYQGSILAITDDNANVVEKRLFDAWGSIIKVQDGAGNTLNGLTVIDRGYTGHEHLQSVGLINMNARLYDPLLHRFLSVDNYIQDPTNTQNYNQYGYVYNNPNKYADFSGNLTQKNIDPKNPTHPTELEEVIVSRRSPAGYNYMSYGPSLAMNQLPVGSGNISVVQNRSLQTASLVDGNVTGFDIVNVGIGLSGIAIVQVQNAMTAEAAILKNKNTLTSLGKLAKLRYGMVGVDKVAQRLGAVGAVLTTGKVAMDYFNGKDLTAGQLFDVGVAVGLAVITISNPIALVGFGVYGLLDATGALDSIKSSLGGDTVILKSNY